MNDPAARPLRNFRLGPFAVSSIALTVLGVCAAAIVVFPARPVSLRSLSNWHLAELLPGAHDFPPDWNYSLSGVLHRSAPGQRPASEPAPARDYAPPSCRPDPAIAELDGGTGNAARVYVDRNTDELARPHLLGEENPDPHADIVIWAASDGPVRIAKYVAWLHKCGRYNVSSLDPLKHTPRTTAVTATIDSHPDDGDAALAFTRSSTQTAPQPGSAIVTHVTYYWVRGVLLECSTNLPGADRDPVNHVVAQTLQKLREA